MVLSDRSLTNQKDGLSNSLNLTIQDFYVRSVDEKNKENNSVLASRPLVSSQNFRVPFDSFPPLLRLDTQAILLVTNRCLGWLRLGRSQLQGV